MTTTTHKRSIHIDAPVERVFDYVKDPQKYFDAWFESTSKITDIKIAEEGVGTTYEWTTSVLHFFHINGVMTRQEYVPNQRFVDRSSTGPVWTYTFEPDQTGTTLSIEFDLSSKVPFADKVLDSVAWDGDRDLDSLLANLKKAIEA